MLKRLPSIVVIVILIAAITYLFLEKMRLEQTNTKLRADEEIARKEVDAERATWTKVYKDCMNENKNLISRLKQEQSQTDSSSK